MRALKRKVPPYVTRRAVLPAPAVAALKQLLMVISRRKFTRETGIHMYTLQRALSGRAVNSATLAAINEYLATVKL